MDEGGRDDNTGAELLDGHEDICTNAPYHELVQEQWGEDADGTSDEDYEERPNPQSHVVLALAEAARDLLARTTNTVPVTLVSDRRLNRIRQSILNTGVEMAVLFLRLCMRVSMGIFMVFLRRLALGMNGDVIAVRVHAEPEYPLVHA
jgi:hypothetical protein